MAVLVSVGPGAPEVRRLRDLVSSLIRYAPRGWLIVIDDNARARRHHWLHVPVGEDIVVSLYARAASLCFLDASLPGQPFCSKWRGLASSPGAPHQLRRN